MSALTTLLLGHLRLNTAIITRDRTGYTISGGLPRGHGGSAEPLENMVLGKETTIFFVTPKRTSKSATSRAIHRHPKKGDLDFRVHSAEKFPQEKKTSKQARAS